MRGETSRPRDDSGPTGVQIEANGSRTYVGDTRVVDIRVPASPVFEISVASASESQAMDRLRRAIDEVTRPTAVATARASTSELGCPRCRAGALIAGSRGWGCSRWREGCRFVVWFETAGRRLSAAQLRDLVTRGKTRKARFVHQGVEIDGRLVLDAAADGGARFERV
jgi:DNA topoisomerase-3